MVTNVIGAVIEREGIGRWVWTDGGAVPGLDGTGRGGHPSARLIPPSSKGSPLLSLPPMLVLELARKKFLEAEAVETAREPVMTGRVSIAGSSLPKKSPRLSA